MHPAFSVIFFTVSSGAGFGLVAVVSLLLLLGGVSGLSQQTALIALGLGVVLATAGLLSSTLHLANPRNAWRAFFRFRSSWLSREGVFAVLFFPVAAFFFLGLMTQGVNNFSLWVWIAGLLTVLLALTVVFTTGMIYASLRTIPQWNNALVPLNYLLLGLASGAVLLTAVASIDSGQAVTIIVQLSLTLLAAAGLAKAVYYFWIGKPQGPMIQSAIGMTRGRARLLEAGQSSDNFLNKEFGYQASAGVVGKLRWLVFVIGFGLPLALLSLMMATGQPLWALPAALLLLGGLLVERWLFFAEARHTVNLFYGRQRC